MPGLLFEPYVATQPRNWIPTQQLANQSAQAGMERRKLGLMERHQGLEEQKMASEEENKAKMQAFVSRVVPALALIDPNAPTMMDGYIQAKDGKGLTEYMHKTFSMGAEAEAARASAQVQSPQPAPVDVQPSMEAPAPTPKEARQKQIEVMSGMVAQAKDPKQAIEMNKQLLDLRKLHMEFEKLEMQNAEWTSAAPGSTPLNKRTGETGKALPEKQGARLADFQLFEAEQPNFDGLAGSDAYAKAFKAWREVKARKPDSQSANQEMASAVATLEQDLGATFDMKRPIASQLPANATLEQRKKAREIDVFTQFATIGTPQVVGLTPAGPATATRGLGGGKLSGDFSTPLIPKTMGRAPAEFHNEVGMTRSVVEDARTAIKEYEELYTGPFRGRYKELIQKIDNDPEYEVFRSRVKGLIRVAYSWSGKQISEKEMQILSKAILPDGTQMGQNFLAKLKYLDDLTTRIVSGKAESFQKGGYYVPGDILSWAKGKGAQAGGGTSVVETRKTADGRILEKLSDGTIREQGK